MAVLRIGTRESELAMWQARTVQSLLKDNGITAELVPIKSEGDIDTVTPLYAIGVTGVFTRTLDAALLAGRVDIAVHSMKDVPVQLAQGLVQAAVLERGSHKDIFVPHPQVKDVEQALSQMQEAAIATSSIRRIAQWKRKYPQHTIENLRGNVNTRLRKVSESDWLGAIFAAAGLERIGLRPAQAIDLDWMLPAPAQGAIMIVCRQGDLDSLHACKPLNHDETAACTKIEKDFLRTLMGGCSTPISGLAQVKDDRVWFQGNICTPDGTEMVEVSMEALMHESGSLGETAGNKILQDEKAKNIIQKIKHGGH